MALTNAQYDQIMRTYELRQFDNESRLRKRYQDVYQRAPRLKEIDEQIAALSVSKAKLLLEGDDSAMGQLREQLSQLFLKKNQELVNLGLPENYLELEYFCKECKDTGYIGSEKCSCLKKAIIDLLYTDSNLKEVLKEENFSTFSMDFYSENYIDPLTGRSSYESMKIALDVSRQFVNTFSGEFHNLLLYGDTGVGKTFLSNCIAKELMDQSYSVIYFSASSLFDYFAKNKFGKKESEEEEPDHIYECDLLIIDDLGTELPNAFTVSQLFVCLNERILRKKSTIISTNLSLEDINSTYTERVFSRISSNYTMLRLIGDDIRIQKKLLKVGGTNNGTS